MDCDVVHVYSNWGLGLLPVLSGRQRKRAAWIYDLRSGPIKPGLSRQVVINILRLKFNFSLTQPHLTAKVLATRCMAKVMKISPFLAWV